jgi:heptosyltransferase-3
MFKALPVATVARVVSELADAGHRVLLTSGPDEEEIRFNKEILRLCGSRRIDNLSGKTSLKELAALIEVAKLLITVDSVPLHMASALKTSVVVMFGPTSEQTWAPWQHPESRVVTAKVPCRPCYMAGCGGSYRSDCLDKITAKEILSAVYELL